MNNMYSIITQQTGKEELRHCESNQQKCSYHTESEKHPVCWIHWYSEIRGTFDFFFSFTSQSSPELCCTLHHLATGSGTTSHSSLVCFRIFTKVDFPAAVGKAFRNNVSEKPPTVALFNQCSTLPSIPVSQSPTAIMFHIN